MAALDARSVAVALGGEARGKRQVIAPGPGHSAADRSLSILIEDDAPDGIIVNSFAHDDPIVCRDYVRSKLGLPAWKPNGNGVDRTSRDRPAVPVHSKWGLPQAVYRYRNAEGALVGVVCRWDMDGGTKELRPAVPIDGGWRWEAFAEPRPLYRLQRFADEPDAQVLVVEGEKCADIGAVMLPMIVTTWAGGASALQRTDWSPLAGRRVILWPDNDKPGKDAMQAIARLALQYGASSIKMIDPTGTRPKWDLADASTEGWSSEKMIAWARERAKTWELPPPTGNVVSISGEPVIVRDDAWRAHLKMNAEMMPKPRASMNFEMHLRHHPDMKGVIAWNDVSREISLVRQPPWASGAWQPRAITQDDVTLTTYWLEKNDLSPKPTETMAAMSVVARDNRYNPIRDYLNALVWDGIPRLSGGMWEGGSVVAFPAEYMGTPDHPIYATFMRRWFVSAVARVMHPGCKADCMVVLEGDQGTMKSTMLRVLATVGGVEYFTDDIHDIESKDAALQMQGVWIAEIAELNAFQRKEADAIKSWLSRSTDRFRPPYERVVVAYPRHSVIAGTLNPVGGYMTDPTGARRFWPVPVKARIDIDRIVADRDQIWAEAVTLFHRGESWHLTDDEGAEAAQAAVDRYTEDPWDALIDAFVRDTQGPVTMAAIIVSLGIPRSQQNQGTSRRIGARLRHLAYEKKRSRHSDDGYEWVRRAPLE